MCPALSDWYEGVCSLYPSSELRRCQSLELLVREHVPRPAELLRHFLLRVLIRPGGNLQPLVEPDRQQKPDSVLKFVICSMMCCQVRRLFTFTFV